MKAGLFLFYTLTKSRVALKIPRKLSFKIRTSGGQELENFLTSIGRSWYTTIHPPQKKWLYLS